MRGGGACRPCGASAHSPRRTGHCGSSRARTGSTRTRPTRCPSAAKWVRIRRRSNSSRPQDRSSFQQHRPVAFRQVQLQPGPAPSGQPRLSSAVTDRRMMRPRDGSQVVCQAMRSPPLGTRRPMTRADRVSGPSGPPRDGARRPVAERDAGYRARCQRVLAATTRLKPPNRSQVATSSRASAPGLGADGIFGRDG
jgi:hypothetical protein